MIPVRIILPLVLGCQVRSGDSASPPEPLMAASRPPSSSASMMDVIGIDRRQFEEGGPGLLTAHISGVMDAELTSGGLLAWSGDDMVSFRTVSVSGQAVGATEPVLGDCAPTSEQVGSRCAAAAELRYGSTTEWWTSSASSVHQGWTLMEPPSPGAKTIELRMVIDEGELLAIDPDGAGATILGSTGARWRYEELSAWDANGTLLAARIVDDFPYLLVIVDVGQARWPVIVDPSLGPAFAVEEKITPSDGDRMRVFGLSVSGAGDIDGDGYADLVVGSYPGRSAYVYYGSSSGIRSNSEDKLTAPSSEDNQFGWSVSDAGDVNGDGYDDLVIGTSHDERDGIGASVYVYYGSSSGIRSSSADKIIASDGRYYFSWSVSGAGDINGDGYADLIVGATSKDNNGRDSGSVYVYYGSSSGIRSSSEDKVIASDGVDSDGYGRSVSGAGDVNGDGYDDVVVGAYHDNYNLSSSGSVYVYYGSSSGIRSSSADKIIASDGSDYFGWSVSGAGDINGDGYADLIVGAPSEDNNGWDSGSAYVHYGSSSGIRTHSEDKIIASDNNAHDQFGYSVSGAGDVDGDGYDDLVVGAVDGDDYNGSSSGSAYVYYGSSSGIRQNSENKLAASDSAILDRLGFSVSGAGDVDGDGYTDLVVGAPLDDDNGENSGSAYVFYGDCRDDDADGSCSTSDCDDSDGATYPGAAFAESSTACMTDADGDGYGDSNPTSGVTAGTDCDDTDGTISPAAAEVCDGIDNNCDDVIDPDCDSVDDETPVGGADDDVGKAGCGSGCASSASSVPGGGAVLFGVMLVGWLGTRRHRSGASGTA